MQNTHLFAHFVSILIIQPKVIDVSLVTTFGILLILIWALPEEGAYVKSDLLHTSMHGSLVDLLQTLPLPGSASKFHLLNNSTWMKCLKKS